MSDFHVKNLEEDFGRLCKPTGRLHGIGVMELGAPIWAGQISDHPFLFVFPLTWPSELACYMLFFSTWLRQLARLESERNNVK
jgi:hypothetical protein